MIKLLKRNPGIAFIIVPLITIAIWSLSYNGFTVATTGAMPLYDLLLHILPAENKIGYFVLGLLLVISQAFHLNYVFNKNEVIYKNSWLPSLFYVLLMSLIPQFLAFQPVLITNSISIFILEKIFRLYKNQQPLSLDFDTGMLISISSLFYFPSIFISLLFFSGIIILKPFSWRDWVVGFLGMLLPFFLMFTYYFLTDQFQYFTARFFTSNIRQQIDVAQLLPQGFGVTIGYISLLLLLSVFALQKNFSKNVIRTRNYQQMMFIFIITAALEILTSPVNQLYRFIILAIPFSFLIAYYFLAIKKTWFAETAFWILICNILFNLFWLKTGY